MQLFLTIVFAVFMFGFMIFFHELGHFTVAKLSGIKVNEFAIGFGPKILRRKKGDTTYSLRLLPLGGFVSMEGEDEESDEIGSFSKAPVSNRIAVVLAGGIMNLILGFLVLVGLTLSEGVIASTTISWFDEGASTEASGLQIDDEILSVNGRRVFVIDDIIYELQRIEPGEACDVTVRRDGEKLTIPVVFDITEDPETGINMLRYDFKVYALPFTFYNVIRESFNWSLSIARLIYITVLDLITGRAAINQLTGPIGIVSEISNAVSYGFSTVAYLFAIITINLGVCNLLPLPALDGGRLVFLLVEAISRRKLNPKYEGLVHLVGMALLMLLMVVVAYNDITRLV